MAKCRETLDAEGLSVLLLDREGNELYFPYQSEADPEVGTRLAGLRFPAERGIAGSVLNNRTPECVNDPASDPRFYSEVDRRIGSSPRRFLPRP
jgi:hypothetical protein